MSAANTAQAAPEDVPGFPQISVRYYGHRHHEGTLWVWVRFSGWPDDLIAAGLMSAAWLQPTGKHLRDSDGAPASVARSWRLRDGAPQRWCQVLRAKPVERLDTLPGARAAVMIYMRRETEREWRVSADASLRELGRAIMPAACRDLIEQAVADSRGAIG
jgi:hypothetical protein